MKFFTDKGEIATVKADQVATQWCYNASLKIQKHQKKALEDTPRPDALKVMIIDLDLRKVKGGRLESDGELEEIQIGKESGQTT